MTIDNKTPQLVVKKELPGYEEKYFLEGPRSRLKELFFSIKVLFEFIRGFRVLHFAGPCIAVFGSARVKPGSDYYELGRKTGAGIAGLGFTVMTGGGPGIMEAANRGAKEAGGKSVGCTISLPKEQVANNYLDLRFNCKYFFVRKVLMFKYSYGFVILPGGAGTLDEFSEALTLIQTHKILNFPLVLMNRGYWEPLMPLFHKMIENYMISPDDLQYILITDSVDDAMKHLHKYAVEQYHAKRIKEFRRIVLFGE
ncbi:TIGR00730 family Rossman fold protein [Chitinophaga oryzae]|uniref:Cytokinin riboside 5'-monophosphate phosphoribohydrolase n=1 Tax=Chitinophaga oryzae TaxID=2725414 RepID=A0AAE7D5Q3_9BACT|nr:TIGR00730 family Rossman fold protein [Chitinophaga oryzae]QJB30465.1 TIGR00730 family Rossman fold protein [Chitinophaga oryzae]